MLKFENTKVVQVQDWDDLVKKTYGKPYSFQQQDGCQSRGIVHLEVPSEGYDFENLSIPEEINGDEMGVSFASWLARDVTQAVGNDTSSWSIPMFWERNFYPSMDMLVDDLHAKGLIEAGEYVINIDW